MDVGRATMHLNLYASLLYGATLLLAPEQFCDLLQAEPVNLAWLRTIGAALLGTNVLGSWLWLRSPSLDVARIQFATALLEAVAMLTSLLLGEFTAERLYLVQGSVFLAFLVSAGLWPTLQVEADPQA